MERRSRDSPRRSNSVNLRFGKTSVDLLSAFLTNLSTKNKEKLHHLSQYSAIFKDKKILEFIFLMTKSFQLDPLVGYDAIELLQSFMVKYLEEFFAAPAKAAATPQRSHEDAAVEKLEDVFPLIIFSCVLLASKLSLHSQAIYYRAAVHFLHTLGLDVSKETLLDLELMVMKKLEFRLNVQNPLMYVETLLEVLGHNVQSFRVERLHQLCCQVLLFVTLERADIYDLLLMATTQSATPSREQRENFVPVTEDYMLLGVGVITVAAFILHGKRWRMVVGELNHITGISKRSIYDFAQVTVKHILTPV